MSTAKKLREVGLRILPAATVIAVFAAIIFVKLWAYDFDPRCLVVECRVVKP